MTLKVFSDPEILWATGQQEHSGKQKPSVSRGGNDVTRKLLTFVTSLGVTCRHFPAEKEQSTYGRCGRQYVGIVGVTHGSPCEGGGWAGLENCYGSTQVKFSQSSNKQTNNLNLATSSVYSLSSSQLNFLNEWSVLIVFMTSWPLVPQLSALFLIALLKLLSLASPVMSSNKIWRYLLFRLPLHWCNSPLMSHPTPTPTSSPSLTFLRLFL